MSINARHLAVQPINIFRTSNDSEGSQASKAAAAAYLSLISGVEKIGEATLSRMGIKKAPFHCLPGATFQLIDPSSSIEVETDGHIVIQVGRTPWKAIVEVSIGDNELDPKRVNLLHKLAKQEGFDAVITIGNSHPTEDGLPPIKLDRRRLKKIPICHFSWENLFSAAKALSNNVNERCEQWILSEWLKYMEDSDHPIALRYGLGPHWEAVEKMARESNLKSQSKELVSVSEIWRGYLLMLASQFSSKYGAKVEVRAPEGELSNDELHTSRIANRLANNHCLSGRLQGAGMRGSLHLSLLPATGEAKFSVDLPIPSGDYQIQWLRSLSARIRRVEERGVDMVHAYWDQKSLTSCSAVTDLVKDPICLQRLDEDRKVPSDANPIRLVFERTVQLQGHGRSRSAQLLDHLAAELHAFFASVVLPMLNRDR